MGSRKPPAATRVLLGVADDVDRTVLESDLLRVGYQVSTAQSVEEALNSARLGGYDVLVVEIGLAGGGGFSLCRKLAGDGQSMPTVGLSVRPVDLEVRRMGAECGMESFVAPFHRGQLEAAVETVIARDRIRNTRDRGLHLSGQLAEWTVADLIRYMQFYGFTGDVELGTREQTGGMHFRDGTLTAAELGETFGERALASMLEWNEGFFSLNTTALDAPDVPTVRPPRNIHRAIGALLIDALGPRADVERDLASAPGIDEAHELDLERARRLCHDTQLLARLHDAVDGHRTLRQVLYTAKVEKASETQQVLTLVHEGALHPVEPTRLPDPITDPIEPAGDAPDRAVTPVPLSDTTIRKGATVSRKLGFKRKKPGEPVRETFAELDDDRNGLSERRSRERLRMTWISIATIITVILLSWYFLSSDDNKVPEVRVIDDVEQQ